MWIIMIYDRTKKHFAMSGKKGIFANGKDSDPSYQHSTNQALTHTA